MKKLIIILSILIPLAGFSQKEAKLIREGNKSFEKGDFKEAEINYRKSLEKNDKSVKGKFNLADALYEQKDYENAQQMFDALSKNIEDPMKKAEAFHNLGNSFLAADKYQESIEAYKNALRNNPNDMDTKYNLEYARQKLQDQQQQQQNQDQNKDQNKDQQDKQDQQDQQNQNKDQQNQKDQQQKQDQNNKDQQQQQQPRQISKQDAERMLQALKNEEKKTIEKLKKEKAKAAKVKKSEKDW